MPWLRLPDGTAVHIRVAKPPKRRCSCCKQLGAERLCDWKITPGGIAGKRKDCDRPICTRCSTVPAHDKDLCREHAEQWGARVALAYMLAPMTGAVHDASRGAPASSPVQPGDQPR